MAGQAFFVVETESRRVASQPPAGFRSARNVFVCGRLAVSSLTLMDVTLLFRGPTDVELES